MAQKRALIRRLFPEVAGLSDAEATPLITAALLHANRSWKVRGYFFGWLFIAVALLRGSGVSTSYFVAAALFSVPYLLVFWAEARKYLRTKSHA